MSYEYINLIKEDGIAVIDFLSMGGYQGDLLVIVKKDDKFGETSIGWGSCSGCDALQACSGREEEIELGKSICDSIIWYSASDFIAHLKEKDWAGQYYHDTDGLQEFIDSNIENVLMMHLAKI